MHAVVRHGKFSVPSEGRRDELRSQASEATNPEFGLSRPSLTSVSAARQLTPKYAPLKHS